MAIYYFWDTWLDASVGIDVEYVPNGNGWYESMLLPNGQYIDLTHSKGVNKSRTQEFGAWGEAKKYFNMYAECAAENLYSVTLYHFADKPNDGTAHQHVILSEKHETYFSELNITKVWLDGGNTEKRTDIVIQLYAVKDGVETPVEGKTLILNEANNWTGKFEGLPKNNDNNEMIYYIVKEMNSPEGYNSKMTKNYTGKLGSISANYTITNTLKTKVTVKKEWQDTNDVETFRPQSIQVALYSNGNATGIIKDLDESNNWTATFEELEKYDTKNKKIEYTIKEISVDDYKTEYITIEDSTTGYTTVTITNTLSPEYAGYIEITGKVWEDIRKGNDNALNNVIDEDESGMGGIKVTLKDKDGNQFDATSTTTTAEDGTYKIKVNYDNSSDVYKLYEDDSIKSKKKKITETKLSTAYIEFEYDGYTYTTVKNKVTTKKVINEKGKTVSVKTTQAEQSKAKEVWQSKDVPDKSTKTRQVLDKKYSTITSTSPLETEILKEDNNVIATTKGVIKFDKDNYLGVKENKVLANVEERTETQTVKYCNGDGTYIHTNPDGAWNEIIQGNHVCENCPGTGHPVKTFDQIEVKTIKNVNLGLFKREMPDLSIDEDIHKVEMKVKVNNKWKSVTVTDLNKVKVEAINEDKNAREQYEAKQAYTYGLGVDPNNIKDLYVTYKVQIKNESEKLKAEVDSIINCFDNRYEFVSAKKKGADNNIAKKYIIGYNDQENESIYKQNSGDYTEIKINNLNLTISAGKSSTILYLKYKVKDGEIPNILNEDLTLNNSVEIETYTTYYGSTYYPSKSEMGSKVYAGYDKDSHPGNAGMKLEHSGKYKCLIIEVNEKGKIEDQYNKSYENVKVLKSTENIIEYTLTNGEKIKMPEDDTNIAPSFTLTMKGERPPLPESGTIGGTVFEDTDVRGQGERVGNGYYDNTEKTVENVNVELWQLQRNDEGEITGARFVYEDDTSIDGSYELEGFEKDKEYYIKFIYGDNIDEVVEPGTTMDEGATVVNARNYKSTIITDKTIAQILEIDYEDEQFDKLWYTKHKDGYSVAVDDMEERLDIENLKYSNFHKSEDNDDIYVEPLNMTAYTKPFLVEDNTINISTFDFGIIERPRENLSIDKTITNIKLTLSNGQILTQGDPRDPNANINYVKAIGFGIENSSKKELLAEMDAELIQGALLELKYEVTVTNNNEIDYDYGNNSDYEGEFGDTINLKYVTNEKSQYYYFGKSDDLSPMQATIKYVDYLNNDIVYNDNDQWEKIEVDELHKEGQEFVNDKVHKILNENKYQLFEPKTAEGEGRITIARGETTEALAMSVSKILGSKDENVYDNNVEIIEIDGKTARTIEKVEDGKQIPKSYKPGNLEPGASAKEQDEDINETTITPPTGIITYILYVLAGLAGLIVIAGGITFIKKKVLIK